MQNTNEWIIEPEKLSIGAKPTWNGFRNAEIQPNLRILPRITARNSQTLYERGRTIWQRIVANGKPPHLIFGGNQTWAWLTAYFARMSRARPIGCRLRAETEHAAPPPASCYTTTRQQGGVYSEQNIAMCQTCASFTRRGRVFTTNGLGDCQPEPNFGRKCKYIYIYNIYI